MAATPTPAVKTTTPAADPNTKKAPMPGSDIKPAAGNGAGVPAVATDDDLFDSMSSSGKYLPRLQMFGSKSDAVGAGKIPMAHYGLVTGKDKITDLGPEVQIVAYAWRPKALDTSGDDVINCHNHADPEFKRIQEQSEVKDSGCMYGPEFLVWLPAVKKWAGLFMSSKTARREAPAIRDRLDRPSTLGTEFIQTKKYSWHGVICRPCSTPFDLPSDESKADQVDRFMNPPVEEVEEKAPATAPRAR